MSGRLSSSLERYAGAITDCGFFEGCALYFQVIGRPGALTLARIEVDDEERGPFPITDLPGFEDGPEFRTSRALLDAISMAADHYEDLHRVFGYRDAEYYDTYYQ